MVQVRSLALLGGLLNKHNFSLREITFPDEQPVLLYTFAGDDVAAVTERLTTLGIAHAVEEDP